MSVIGPSINDITSHNGVPSEDFSIIFIIRSVAAVIGSFLFMPFFDRYKAKTLLSIVLIISAAFYGCLPLITHFTITCIIFFILGGAFSIINASGNILITRIYGVRSAPFLSGLHFSFGIGAFLMPIFISWIRYTTGSSLPAYWVISGVALVVVLCLLFLPEIPQRKHEVEQTKSKSASLVFTITAVAFLFFFEGAEITFGVYVYNYALVRGVVDSQAADFLTSVFFGVYTLTRFLIIPLAAKIDNTKIIVTFLAGNVLSFIILFLLPAVSWMVFILAAVVGFFLAPIIPVFLAYIEKELGLTGKLAGILQVSMVAGGTFFPWLIGLLLKPATHSLFPIILGLCITSTLAIYIVLLLMKKGSLKKQTC